MSLLLVLAGGAVGAVARFLTDRYVQATLDPVFPWGTFAVNLAGSFVLGVLAGVGAGAAGLPDWVRLLAGTGFCGALTTYSTFGFETVRLFSSGARGYASINAVATVLVGFAACALGWLLSR